MEGISHFAYRNLYCKIDIENSKWGRIEKKLFCYHTQISARSLLAYCISRDIMPKDTLISFWAHFRGFTSQEHRVKPAKKRPSGGKPDHRPHSIGYS